MPKICAEGARWLAEIEGPDMLGLFAYRYRARNTTTWQEASAGSENEAITTVASRLGDARLLGPDEMIMLTQARSGDGWHSYQFRFETAGDIDLLQQVLLLLGCQRVDDRSQPRGALSVLGPLLFGEALEFFPRLADLGLAVPVGASEGVGPLAKESVRAVIDDTALSVTTLALNYPRTEPTASGPTGPGARPG